MKYVAYYRVSTKKQGASGLGLDAQVKAVADFAKNGELIAEFREVESGSKDSRPILAKALEVAKANGATLLIAKLDRLSRRASFIFALRDSGVNFIACDMPEANRLTIDLLAVIAEHEREMIKARTAAAQQERSRRKTARIIEDLQAAGLPCDEPSIAAEKRRRDVEAAKYQIDSILPQARLESIAVKKEAVKACPEWSRAAELAKSLRKEGLTFRAIAERLNATAFVTREKKPFHAMTVKRLLVA